MSSASILPDRGKRGARSHVDYRPFSAFLFRRGFPGVRSELKKLYRDDLRARTGRQISREDARSTEFSGSVDRRPRVEAPPPDELVEAQAPLPRDQDDLEEDVGLRCHGLEGQLPNQLSAAITAFEIPSHQTFRRASIFAEKPHIHVSRSKNRAEESTQPLLGIETHSGEDVVEGRIGKRLDEHINTTVLVRRLPADDADGYAAVQTGPPESPGCAGCDAGLIEMAPISSP